MLCSNLVSVVVFLHLFYKLSDTTASGTCSVTHIPCMMLTRDAYLSVVSLHNEVYALSD